jgi:Putative zinc-binding metallo-peptidase
MESEGINRRKFLLGAGAAMAVGMASGEAQAATDKENENAKPLTPEAFDALLERRVKEGIRSIEDQYGIWVSFDYDDRHAAFADDKKLSTGEQCAVLEHLIDALARYPQSLVKKSELQVISLGKNLSDSIPTSNKRLQVVGLSVGGFVIYVDTEHGPDAFIHTVHHELFHAFTFRRRVIEKAWIELHRPYVEGNPYERMPDGSPVHPDFFITSYAAKNVQEDVAEMAPYVMDPLLHVALLEAIEKDLNPEAAMVLQRKYQIIQTHFNVISDGEMDEKFWKNIVAEGYRMRAELIAKHKSERTFKKTKEDYYPVKDSK